MKRSRSTEEQIIGVLREHEAVRRRVISRSRAPSTASALPENTLASPSTACSRQAAIIV